LSPRKRYKAWGGFGSAALWGRARRGLGAVRGRGSRLRGRWSFSPAGFRRAWPRGGRSDRGAGSCVPCSWARDCAVPGGHAPSLGRRHARARVERSRVACAGVYAVPARAGWGRVHVGAALQGFGRAQRQRMSGAEDAGSVGVCLPGANNVMSRTHMRQDARALSRSLERSLPLSLSLSRSLSQAAGPRGGQRSLPGKLAAKRPADRVPRKGVGYKTVFIRAYETLGPRTHKCMHTRTRIPTHAHAHMPAHAHWQLTTRVGARRAASAA
jgi:hypothetical protein